MERLLLRALALIWLGLVALALAWCVLFLAACGPEVVDSRGPDTDGQDELRCVLQRGENPCLDLLEWAAGPCGDLGFDDRSNCVIAVHLLLGRQQSPVAGQAVRVAQACSSAEDDDDCDQEAAACLGWPHDADARTCELFDDPTASACQQLAGCFEAVDATGVQGVGGTSVVRETICGALFPESAGCA